MIKLEMQFDGGLEAYQKAFDPLIEGLQNFESLFNIFIEYFEGRDTGLSGFDNIKSPIIEIFESEGGLINGDWGYHSTEYEEWKDKHWEEEREYSFAYVSNESKQILSGRTLYSLLHSDSDDAVREVSNNSMIYGTDVPYAYYNQTTRKILDFFPEMEKNMDHLIAFWVKKIAPGLEFKDE